MDTKSELLKNQDPRIFQARSEVKKMWDAINKFFPDKIEVRSIYDVDFSDDSNGTKNRADDSEH